MWEDFACSQHPVQLLVGGKGLPYETQFGPTDVCRHVWEANIEPKLELPVDTATCGRRQTQNQNWNYQWIQSYVGGEKQTYQSFETKNIGTSIITSFEHWNTDYTL